MRVCYQSMLVSYERDVDPGLYELRVPCPCWQRTTKTEPGVDLQSPGICANGTYLGRRSDVDETRSRTKFALLARTQETADNSQRGAAGVEVVRSA